MMLEVSVSRKNSVSRKSSTMDFSYFTPLPGVVAADLPSKFPSPFKNYPHALARAAADDLQRRLESGNIPSPAGKVGKMLGVLVVVRDGVIGYLSAFSGNNDGGWNDQKFAPPLVNTGQLNNLLAATSDRLDACVLRIDEARRAFEDLAAMQEGDTALQAIRDKKIELQTRNRCRASARAKVRDVLDSSTDAADELGPSLRLKELALESQQDRKALKSINQKIRKIEAENKLAMLAAESQLNREIEQRRSISSDAQRGVFELYHLGNFDRETISIARLLDGTAIPAGTGDCAAPKLLKLCQQLQMAPVALAEFWWGADSLSGIRHHKTFYPSCRSKCGLILPYMLGGLAVQAAPAFHTSGLRVGEPLYEDEVLAVIEKPSGLLSIPGKATRESVYSQVREWWPGAEGPLLVHRLDMETSGLLLLAKSLAAHKILQRQFISRSIKKTYEAVLEREIVGNQGVVDLPLRVDLEDRPRQLVCRDHGKSALTHWRKLTDEKRDAATTRVAFSPVTGRTHQLRVHAAHPAGLGVPIAGDSLYGSSRFMDSEAGSASRLKLHATQLVFSHPLSGESVSVKSEAPF